MIYGFYRKGDISKEVIYRSSFTSLAAAVKFFTQLKRLTPYEFNQLYQITVVEEKISKRDGTD